MNSKKIIFALVFALLCSVFSANAVDYYKVYQPSFTNEPAENIYVAGGVCGDSQCSSITSQEITLLDGDMFQSCMEQSGSMNINEFQVCLNDSEINGNIATLGSSGWIVTKETVGSFGSLTYFMPEGDQNIPVFFETTNYPQVCSAQGNTYCVDDNIYGLNFNQLNEAIAEVGQVNIKNVDNPLKPIQVEIPVQIEETVCSAYRFANENYWYPTQIPQGYSDFDAMTQIDLLIQDSQGTTLLDDQVVIPIEAETCAGLSAFSWTPAAELEDEEVTFTITTEVIDRQVITSLIDTASVTETIYPNNLDNTCWTRAYDFTLANEPTFDLTTSIAQIQQGEYLYAGFRAGAWRDESITPMQFEAILVFDNGDEETILTTFQDTSGLDLEEYFEDLSETVFDLQPGNYEVTLITRPIGTNCLTSEEVRQTQQLTILEVPKYSLDVYVSGNESQALENVQLQVVLEESRDEFQITPTYDETQTTNTQGYSEFTGLIAGTYTYTASLEGYSTVTNEVIVGSDTQLYINLPQENSAPIVDLPQEVTVYFEEAYELQLQDYIVDFNDAFNTLTIETSLVSGDASIQTINTIAEITTTTPNTVTISVSVEDSSGASAQDSMTINFIDNNEPSITRYEADPTNGQEPFTTNFLVEVEDLESQTLTCTIDFDDGTTETFECSQNDGLISIEHTFTQIGQYNTVLSVQDDMHTVTAQEKVFVFERTYSAPQILTFDIDSSNGLDLPTDITLDWTTTHPDDLEMVCTLRINGVNNAVDCNSSFELSNHVTPGTNVFTLVATDGERQDLRRIERVFSFPQDNAPEASISVDQTSGISPLNVTFTTQVSDDNDQLSDLLCTIEFGDGESIQDTCDILTTVEHTYTTQTQAINFRALLIVEDSVENEKRAVSQVIEVASNRGPVIDSFTFESSNGFELPTDLTFNFASSHPQDLTTTCSLEINGVTTPVNCNGEFSVDNYATSGVASFIFRVVDESGLESFRELTPNFIEVNDGPVIDSFSFDSSNGFELPTDLTFNFASSHPQDLATTCSLEINGVTTPVNCNGEFSVENYATSGVASFMFIVVDERGLATIRQLNPNFIEVNTAPVIESFTANQTVGIDSLTTTFSFVLNDEDLDILSYRLSFGDTQRVEGSNTYSSQIEHTYVQAGVYEALLEVTDAQDTVTRTITIEVLDSNSSENRPSIDLFTLSTADDTFILPNTVTLTSAVSHPRGLLNACDLVTPYGTQVNINCNGEVTLENFNISGTSNFTLIVTDSNGISTNRTISQAFYNPEEAPDLSLDNVALDIDSVIVPGAFSFALRTKNETLAQRELFVQPTISCGGVDYNYAKDGGFLLTSALSSTTFEDTFRFPMKTDTVDYYGSIPTEETCLFEARVIDAYGTDIRVIKNVEFAYPQREEMQPSINGYGTDVMDFISNTINEPFTTGYNKIDFTLVNYESEAKELSISIVSTQLGIGYNEEVNLGSDSSKDVTVPLLFTKDQKGTYPIRISINDGDEKQVKYSYITIN